MTIEKGVLNVARARLLVVGGGFAGFYAAKVLSRLHDADVVLVDRTNHHLFQPLLYQVASTVLSPGEIAMPLRVAFRKAPNVTTIMTSVDAVDLEHHLALTPDGAVSYDYLVLAPGSETGYGPHKAWAEFAPGLKTVDDAIALRQRLLLAFEAAARSREPAVRRRLLSFAIVGGGPTGVELAGAFAEIATLTLRRDFHREDLLKEVSITLVERAPRLLTAFPPGVSRYAERILTRMGVRVMTDTAVLSVDETGITSDRGEIPASKVVWAAGVQPSPLRTLPPVARDGRGRIEVLPDLSIPGYPQVFAVGDIASVQDPTGTPLPALAPVAMQEGIHAAQNVARALHGLPTCPFRYRDRGTMAAIGRSRAVAMVGHRSLVGRIAWLVWLVVHIRSLTGFENRLLVLTRWIWAYVFSERSSRLIYGRLHVEGDLPLRRSPLPETLPGLRGASDTDKGVAP